LALFDDAYELPERLIGHVLVQRLTALKELGEWEAIQTVQKYAHLAPSHISHSTPKRLRFGHNTEQKYKHR
jgi:hypothetical protein